MTAMQWLVEPSLVSGKAKVPGDKSISHRALMLSALAKGQSSIFGLPSNDDVTATALCLEQLGVAITSDGSGDFACTKVEEAKLKPSSAVLDTANSGTSMRLLAGILAGQNFSSIIDGDASLRKRPMNRVMDPLRLMGAKFKSNKGYSPLTIEGRSPLRAIEYQMPIASAQVKSAILLGALFADGQTQIVESHPTRDHTERMLMHMGVEVINSATGIITMHGSQPLSPLTITVPGDFSSAAFLLVAAAILGTEIEIEGVGINPGRTGLLEVLKTMGCGVEISEPADECGEPIGNVRVSGRPSKPVVIEAAQVPTIIDELPLVALLGTVADGTTIVRGAEELRIKESDRIASVTTQLRRMGANIEERADGFLIHGPTKLRGATVQSGGDHRLAMMLTVAALSAEGPTTVEGVESAGVSFPDFDKLLKDLGAKLALINSGN